MTTATKKVVCEPWTTEQLQFGMMTAREYSKLGGQAAVRFALKFKIRFPDTKRSVGAICHPFRGLTQDARHNKWTAEADATLIKFYQDQVPFAIIAKEMSLTESAVATRVSMLRKLGKLAKLSRRARTKFEREPGSKQTPIVFPDGCAQVESKSTLAPVSKPSMGPARPEAYKTLAELANRDTLVSITNDLVQIVKKLTEM